MKVFIVLFVLLSSLLSAEDAQESYLGSSYNLALAFEPSCLHFIGNTEMQNEHFGALVKTGACDAYADESQKYLSESFYLGGGISLYSNSIYRDSFMLALSLNIEHSWINDIVQDISGSSYSVTGVAGAGYQWHFRRGYIFSLIVYYSYRKPFSQSNTSDKELAQKLSQEQRALLPTFLVGWRF